MRVHKITNFFSDKSFRRGGILGGQGQRVRPVSSGRPALPVAIQRLTGLMDSLAAIPAAGHWVKKKPNTIHERSKCSSTSPKSSMQMWPWKALSQRRQSMFGVHVDGRWRGIQQTSWRGVMGRRVYRMLVHRNAEEEENMTGLLQLKISHKPWTKSKTSLMTLLPVKAPLSKVSWSRAIWIQMQRNLFLRWILKYLSRQGPSFGGCSIISTLWRQY